MQLLWSCGTETDHESQIVAMNSEVSHYFPRLHDNHTILTNCVVQQYAGGSHCFEQITISYQGKSTQATVVDEVCQYTLKALLPLTFCVVPRLRMGRSRSLPRLVQLFRLSRRGHHLWRVGFRRR